MDKKQLKSRQDSNTREFYCASIRAMSGEGNERKFELSFSSEEPYERWDYVEILEHTEDAVDLIRLNEIGCVLFNHNRDVVIGKIEKAWLQDNRGYAVIEFDTDEESDKFYMKVKNGVLKGVSVGYRVTLWEEVGANKKSTDGRFTGPCSIAKKWFPYEISIVSIPADATVGVGRDLENHENTHQSLNLYQKQIQINKNYI
ncbi:HK97 family phage prohead protease [Anaerocolumna sp. AGMB13020]|uniref:HK97 family phage prohead protease n=1 Tax=Anaerocolumna sp. AGMB13020 TaxID=3081750 RepID=UPI0029549FC6|nr:HK97 family phage prohead protease [Anaerocolumna sp. AGMB13020]WOO34940.1 HK97 family phage prohead protease [Anaerocolumna sp. AGMB13020]